MIITENRTITPEMPAEWAAHGRMVLDRAENPGWLASVRYAWGPLAGDLREAVETYDAIRAGLIHPAAEYDDLKGEPEAQWLAEIRAAEAVRDLAAEIVRVFPVLKVRAEPEGEAA